ncbi:MAG: BatA domain-containing protein [candidate division Zixibacteria bacterium]|nr:BatA domain-containing protein [candidate division Zixibacteria bacterium]
MGGLSFLTPLFLAGAMGALIPLLLHLVRRDRVQVRQLSTFRFLKISHKEVVRQQKLRRLLLLILRMAVCAILAVVFARPFIKDVSGAALAGLQPRAVAILVDISYSMGFANRMDMARRRAEEIIREIAPGDHVALVAFSTQGHLLKETGTDHATVRSLIQTRLLPVNRGTNYTEALRLAEEQVNRSGFEDRTIHLISDFQKTGWDRGAVPWQLGPGVQLKIEDVSGDDPVNAAITDVTLAGPVTRTQRTQDVVARVKNFGGVPYRGTAVLTVNGRQVDSKRVDLAAQSGQTVNFRHTFEEASTGIVELSDDGFADDNRFYFTVETPPPLRILCVEDRDTGRRGGGDLFYLTEALALRSDPPITIDVRSTNELGGISLGEYQAVVLANAGVIGRAAAERLRAYAVSGGGIAIALHPDVSEQVFNTAFSDLAPGRLVSVWPEQDRSDEYRSVADIRYQHPVFQPFAGPHNGDFGTARFFRIARMTVDSSAVVLGSFDDGSPAFVEKTIGRGRVFMINAPLGLEWTDFPIRGVFVPFLYQTVDYLSDRLSGQNQRTQYYHLIGETVRVPGRAGVTVTTPTGAQIEVQTGPDETPLFGETGEPGLYRINDNSDTRHFAVDLDTRESDFTRLDLEEFLSAVINPVTESEEAKADRLQADREENEEMERRQRLWWFLSLALLAVVIGETVLASRTHR